MANSSPKNIAVLGGGATGLATAHRLHQLGHHVRVFERTSRLGGAIRTELVDGWLIESGPNSLLAGDPALARLIDELGLAAVKCEASASAKKRFLVRGGRMLAAPMSPPAFLGSPLFSPFAKIRLFGELFVRARTRTSDVSLSEFIGGHFGREFVDYALNPFVGGIYAGNPARLSTRHAFPKLWELEQKHGSIIRGQIAAAKARKASGAPKPAGGIFSFEQGLQSLIDALAARLPKGGIVLDAAIDSVLRTEPGWNVIWHDTAGTHTQTFDAIVGALPAHALAALRIGPLGERPLAALAGIEHPPVSSLFLGFRRDDVAHPLDGFGVLSPEIENLAVLGVLFSSSMFPGRAPEGHVGLTVMVGGTRRPDLAALPTDQLIEAVQPDLANLLGVSGGPVFVRHSFWPRAIPQYNLGYEQFLQTLTAVEKAHPGLYFGGQARDGIAVPACLAAGEKLAQRALGA